MLALKFGVRLEETILITLFFIVVLLPKWNAIEGAQVPVTHAEVVTDQAELTRLGNGSHVFSIDTVNQHCAVGAAGLGAGLKSLVRTCYDGDEETLLITSLLELLFSLRFNSFLVLLLERLSNRKVFSNDGADLHNLTVLRDVEIFAETSFVLGLLQHFLMLDSFQLRLHI